VGAASSGIGPTVGGLLIAASDWRLVFLINIPVGVAAVVLARRKLVESRTPGRRRMPDLVASLLFALAVAALVLGVVEGQGWGWSSPRIIASFVVAVVLVAVVVWRSTWPGRRLIRPAAAAESHVQRPPTRRRSSPAPGCTATRSPTCCS